MERNNAGALRFFDARGRELAPAPTAPQVHGDAAAALVHANRRAIGQPIGAATLSTWNGVDHLDLDWAVTSLLWHEQRPAAAELD